MSLWLTPRKHLPPPLHFSPVIALPSFPTSLPLLLYFYPNPPFNSQLSTFTAPPTHLLFLFLYPPFNSPPPLTSPHLPHRLILSKHEDKRRKCLVPVYSKIDNYSPCQLVYFGREDGGGEAGGGGG